MAAHACNSSFERKMQFQLQEEEAGILRVYIGRQGKEEEEFKY